MAEFILKDRYGKEKTFDHETIYVKGAAGELLPFTFGTGSSAELCYVTFMSYDGSVEYGKKAVALGDDCADPISRDLFDTPTRPMTQQYSYTFDGWATVRNGAADPNWNKSITRDKTVYAAYKAVTRTYTITYYDQNETFGTVTVLKQETLPYGATPSYTPTKSGVDFAGWDPEPVAVTGDASYYATWNEMISFATSTWAKISELSQNGEAKNYFAIGDTRTVPVTYDGKTYNYTAKIVGFDHDDLRDSDGGGKAGISIMFFTTMATAQQMNTTSWSSSNKGNWGTSSLRTFVNNTFFGYLPADLRSVLRYVKKTYRASGTSTIKQEDARIWIPSINEVGGTNLASHTLNDKQGTLYEYFTYYGYGYSSDTSTKVVDTGNTARTQFWVRSGTGDSVYKAVYIDGGKNAYNVASTNTSYLAIGFCI